MLINLINLCWMPKQHTMSTKHEKLPETSNMVETTKFIVEPREKGVQTEVPTCDKAMQTNKAKNDCIILPILSTVCFIL